MIWIDLNQVIAEVVKQRADTSLAVSKSMCQQILRLKKQLASGYFSVYVLNNIIVLLTCFSKF